MIEAELLERLRSERGNPDLYDQLGDLYAANPALLDKAVRNYHEAARLLLAGGGADRRQRAARAAEVLAKAMPLAPDRDAVLFRLAEALEAAGKTSAAERVYRDLLSRSLPDERPFFHLALLERVAALAPLDLAHRRSTAATRERLGMHASAAQELADVARLEARQGAAPAALADIARALELLPGAPELFEARAEVLELVGDREGATRAWLQAADGHRRAGDEVRGRLAAERAIEPSEARPFTHAAATGSVLLLVADELLLAHTESLLFSLGLQAIVATPPRGGTLPRDLRLALIETAALGDRAASDAARALRAEAGPDLPVVVVESGDRPLGEEDRAALAAAGIPVVHGSEPFPAVAGPLLEAASRPVEELLDEPLLPFEDLPPLPAPAPRPADPAPEPSIESGSSREPAGFADAGSVIEIIEADARRREGELDALRAELQAWREARAAEDGFEARLGARESELDEKARAIAALERECERLRAAQASEAAAAAASQARVAELSAALAAGTARAAELEAQAQRLAARVAGTEPRLEAAEQRLRELDREMPAREERVAAAERERADLAATCARLDRELEAARTAATTAERRLLDGQSIAAARQLSLAELWARGIHAISAERDQARAAAVAAETAGRETGAERDRARARCTALDAATEELGRQRDDLRRERESLAAEREELTRELERARAEAAGSGAESARRLGERDALLRAGEDLTRDLEAERRTSAALREAAAEAIARAEGLAAELVASRGEAATTGRHLAAARIELDGMKPELDQATATAVSLRTSGVALAHEAASERERATDLARDLGAERVERETARAEAAAAAAALAAARERLDEAEAGRVQRDQELAALSQAHAAATADLADARRARDSVREREAELAREIESLRAEGLAARQDGARAASDRDALAAELEGARSRAGALAGEVESLRAEGLAARRDGARAASDRDALAAELEGARSRAGALAGEVESLRAEGVAARQDGARAASDRDALTAELEDTRGRAGALAGEVESLRAEGLAARQDGARAASDRDALAAELQLSRERVAAIETALARSADGAFGHAQETLRLREDLGRSAAELEALRAQAERWARRGLLSRVVDHALPVHPFGQGLLAGLLAVVAALAAFSLVAPRLRPAGSGLDPRPAGAAVPERIDPATAERQPATATEEPPAGTTAGAAPGTAGGDTAGGEGGTLRPIGLSEYAALERDLVRRIEGPGYRVTAKLRTPAEVRGFLAYQASVKGWDEARLRQEAEGPGGTIAARYHFDRKTYVDVLVENLGIDASFDVNAVAQSFTLSGENGPIRGFISPQDEPKVVTSSTGGPPRIEAVTLALEFARPTGLPVALAVRLPGVRDGAGTLSWEGETAR